MIEDLLDFGMEKLNMLDESFNKLSLGFLLAFQIATLEEMDGRNKKNLQDFLSKAKTLFSKVYEDVINVSTDPNKVA